ncbi:MAG: PAS domain S-box protein, partial [Caldimonas sp.]
MFGIVTAPSTQQNEARYRAIFDQAGSGIMLLDLAGQFILVNQRWCDMLGYTEAEMMQLNILDLKHPDDVAGTMANLDAMRLDNPATYLVDRRYRHKQGAEVWVTVSVSTVRDEHGKPEATMALATEITAQKRQDAMKVFLADLAIQLAPLSTAAELTRTTITAVGRYLNVHRCYFVECLPSEDRIIVGENYVSDDAPSLAGTFSLFEFGGFEWWEQYAQGDLAVDDVETNPLISDSIDSYLRLGIRSYAVQPFRREGDWTTVLGVTCSTPRHWSGHDMALLNDVVARVCPLIERARSEDALRALRKESDRRARLYETIMSRTPDFIYVFDLGHHFTYANDALLAMFGKSWDEVVGKTFLEVGYEPWHAEMHGREIDQVRQSREMIRGQVPFTGTNGTRIYEYIFTPVFDANGEVESVAGTTRDVTDSVRADKLLQTQTERRELLGVAATALLTSDDPKRMIDDLYARIAPHFGIDSCYSFVVDDSGESLMLQSAINVPPDIADSVRRIQFGEGLSGTVALDRRPMIAASIQRSTDAHLATTRRIGVNSCACFPLVANGRLLATIAFASSTREAFEPDEVEFFAAVSHYAAVAYERLRLISDLRKADRQKDDFIALLAHELRNPLAPIRTGLQVLRLSQDETAIATAREMMDRQLGHMVRLIEDLLDISRITLNKLTLRRERVLLSQVVMHAVEGARPAVEAAGQELLVTLPTEDVYLDADLTRLAQVFSNLLTNSAKYTGSGGRIQLAATVENGEATIEVRDNGI